MPGEEAQAHGGVKRERQEEEHTKDDKRDKRDKKKQRKEKKEEDRRASTAEASLAVDPNLPAGHANRPANSQLGQVIPGADPELFSRMFTYEETLQCEACDSVRGVEAITRPNPPNIVWPSNTVPSQGNVAFWLPDGWGQGMKTTTGGKQLLCYISPPPLSKRMFHKAEIEKFLGFKLPTRPSAEREQPGENKKSLHSSVPSWPVDDWLPRDWRIAWRKLPSTLHKIFIPPGQEVGFLFHRSCVASYLTEGKTLTKC